MYKLFSTLFLIGFCLCGCVVAKQTVSTVLATAYNAGGAALVGEKIDKLVTDGKLTAQQAKLLKEAAQKSYDQLQKKLTETKTADVEVAE
jgi:polyhydroxyalkanoate synthesis regulator phasin